MDSIEEEPESEQLKIKSYPFFRRFFNRQLIDIDYLTYPRISKTWYFFFGLTFLIVTDFRAAWQASYNQLSTLSYFIGDISLAAGESIRKQLALVYFTWITGAVICAFNLYLSQRNVTLQRWFSSIGRVFEHYSTARCPLYPGLPYTIFKMFNIFIQLNFYSGGCLALLCSLPTLYLYPRGYIIYAIAWLPFNMITGLFCGAYVISFSALYYLFVYIFCEQMDKMSRSFTCSVEEEESTIPDATKIKFHGCLLTRLKRLNASHRFWSSLNSVIFIVTFFVQSMLFYIIFFVQIPKFLLYALIGYAILNFACGQSFHFIFGAYGQRKIDQNCNKLKQLLYMETSIDAKIKSIAFLEHIEGRHFFSVFGALNYSTHHFLLAILESATNLLLIITSLSVKILIK